MKTQSNSTFRSRNKSHESNQIHAATIQQHVRPASSQPIPATDEFAIKEHLNVQWKIEKRAHRFWLTNGCALRNALNDWLKAENEVLAELMKTRTPRHPVQPTPKETKTKIGVTSVLAPAIFNQAPAMSKPKSTAAFHQSFGIMHLTNFVPLVDYGYENEANLQRPHPDSTL